MRAEPPSPTAAGIGAVRDRPVATPSGDERPCPLCGQPLYPWIVLPLRDEEAIIGMPIASGAAAERVLERCENCGAALEAGRTADLDAEWRAVIAAGDQVRIPNRASLQAAIGVEGWSALGLYPGRLVLTPRSLELLAEHNGAGVVRSRTPLTLRSQGWMWQTLLNGLTFHPNFAREVRAGRLRPANARGRFRFWADAVVTTLAAPLVALASVPLELVAALVGRGGEISAQVTEPAPGPR